MVVAGQDKTSRRSQPHYIRAARAEGSKIIFRALPIGLEPLDLRVRTRIGFVAIAPNIRVSGFASKYGKQLFFGAKKREQDKTVRHIALF